MSPTDHITHEEILELTRKAVVAELMTILDDVSGEDITASEFVAMGTILAPVWERYGDPDSACAPVVTLRPKRGGPKK